MNMGTTVLITGLAAGLILLIGAALTSAKQEDSHLKTLLTEVKYMKGEYARLEKQLNELNSRVYDRGKEFNDFLKSHTDEIESLNKKVRDIEFHVLKPRNINVTMMKPIEIKTPDPLKVIGGIKTRQVVAEKKPQVKSTTKKKVSKKKSLRKSKSK